MRVNIYAEEMTDRIEIIEKEVEGNKFTALRFYLELPASFVDGRPAMARDEKQAYHYQAPFIHRPGDDDSSAVTFWGKTDLRRVLRQALDALTAHYSRDKKALGEVYNWRISNRRGRACLEGFYGSVVMYHGYLVAYDPLTGRAETDDAVMTLVSPG